MLNKTKEIRDTFDWLICDYIESCIERFSFDVPDVIFDVHETVYSENYASALHAVILAYGIRKYANLNGWCLYNKCINRAMEILRENEGNKFQKLFIRHYILLSIILLPQKYKKKLAAPFLIRCFYMRMTVLFSMQIVRL